MFLGCSENFQRKSFCFSLSSLHVGASHSSFKFWHDPWVRNLPLISQFSSHVISTSNSHNLATISEFLQAGQRSLPQSNHTDIIDLRSRILQIQVHNSEHVTWNDSRAVSITTIWNSIRTVNSQPPWFDLVWNSFSIPKCSFIAWLALKNRLLTKDRMISFGMNVDPACLLCSSPETVHHLYLDCPYFDLLRCASPVPFNTDWRECQSGNCFIGSPSSIDKQVASVYFTAAVHYVWKERNFRLHNSGKCHPTQVAIQEIKRVVKEKLFSSSKFKNHVAKNRTVLLLLY